MVSCHHHCLPFPDNSWKLVTNKKNKKKSIETSEMGIYRMKMTILWTAKMNTVNILKKAKRQLIISIERDSHHYFGHTVRRDWNLLWQLERFVETDSVTTLFMAAFCLGLTDVITHSDFQTALFMIVFGHGMEGVKTQSDTCCWRW